MLHRGFSAWIVSEDEEIKEELVELNEETNTISCWIPGKTGEGTFKFLGTSRQASNNPFPLRDSTSGGKTTTVVLTLVLSSPSMAFASQVGSSKAPAFPQGVASEPPTRQKDLSCFEKSVMMVRSLKGNGVT